MALLNTAQRRDVWVKQIDAILGGGACPVDKAGLATVVAAADQWVEDNTASFVAALPAGFRTATNATQKTRLLIAVLHKRMGDF